jgi:hypothetical protein
VTAHSHHPPQAPPILTDPCRRDTQERSLCRAVVELASTPPGQGTYFAVSHDAGDSRWDYRHLRELKGNLSSLAGGTFRWRIEVVEDRPFFLAPVQIRESLLDLFAGYPFDPSQGTPDLESIRAHYGELSREFGFQVDPPDLVLVFSPDNGTRT